METDEIFERKAINHDKWVLFDLDGTLADIRHRLKFIRNETPDKPECEFKKNWPELNAHLHLDVVKEPVKKLCQMVFDSGYNIAIVSGRSDQYKPQTIKWLLSNRIPYDEIHMRPGGDYRKDSTVKFEIYHREFFNKGREVLFVVDDRDQVVNMWREQGLTCFQCQKGNY